MPARDDVFIDAEQPLAHIRDVLLDDLPGTRLDTRGPQPRWRLCRAGRRHGDGDRGARAVAEAWDSGAHAWGAAKLDAFAGDPANLVVMTAGLNSSKSDLDIVGWTPPHPPSTCHYVGAYVATKVKYGLSVDQAEKATLVTVAEECDPGDDPGDDPGGQGDGGNGGDTGRDPEGGEGGRSGQPDAEDESPKPTRTTPTVTEDDTAPAADSDDEGALPLTGSPTGVITGVALVLLAAGAVTLAGLRKKNRKV